jgi:hypothetical protein
LSNDARIRWAPGAPFHGVIKLRKLFEFDLLQVTGGQTIPRLLLPPVPRGPSNPPPGGPEDPFGLGPETSKNLQISLLGSALFKIGEVLGGIAVEQATYAADRLYNYLIGQTQAAKDIMDANDARAQSGEDFSSMMKFDFQELLPSPLQQVYFGLSQGQIAVYYGMPPVETDNTREFY